MELTNSSMAIPAEVLLARDFVNTYEPQVDNETLPTPESLRNWFACRGLLSATAELGEADLEAAKTVREGLRSILLGHRGNAGDGAAIDACNRILAEIPVRLEFSVDGYRLLPIRGITLDQALAGLLDAIRKATEAHTWPRLKVCDRSSCRWAFYDTSRNQSRRWCSMAGCGNHIKMKRAYAARIASNRLRAD